MSEQVADWVEHVVGTGEPYERVVIVTETWQSNLRWARNSLTTNGHMHSRTGTVISIARDGQTRAGQVSGAVTGLDDLVALVALADAAVSGAASSEDASPLPEPVVDPGFAQPATQTSMGVFAQFAPALGAAFDGARGAGQLLFGFAEHVVETTWLATSAGARRRAVVPAGRVELNAKDAAMVASAWVAVATADFTDVDVARLYAEAARRLGWHATRVDLPPGRYETLLPPSAVADLVIYAYWTMNARDAEEGRNVYAGAKVGETRIGERLSKFPLRLASDPEALPAAGFAIVPAAEPGMTSVFDNGASVGRTEWITDGTLRQLVRPRSGLRGAGLDDARPTYPTQNLILDAGETSTLDEMIAATKRGLLLTCLWYIREVDPERLLLTGLTRDGVYLVEDGKVVGAVNNFRFNESPVDLLRRATEFGAAEPTLCREWNDYFTWTVVPPMRVPDFFMSTVSPAN